MNNREELGKCLYTCVQEALLKVYSYNSYDSWELVEEKDKEVYKEAAVNFSQY